METIKFRLDTAYGTERWYPVGDSDAVKALRSLTGRATFETRHLPEVTKLGIKVERVIHVHGQEVKLADNE